VLVDDHLRASQGGAPLGTLELHRDVVEAACIVPIDGALVSLREDQLQVPVPAGYTGRTALCCRDGKTPVELSYVLFAEKRARLVQLSDAANRSS